MLYGLTVSMTLLNKSAGVAVLSDAVFESVQTTRSREAPSPLASATSPDTQYATNLNGTEYFMSSDAAAEANGDGASRDLVVWTLSNTASLNTATPALLLSNVILTVNPYSIPPKAVQKKGSTPLIKCLNTPSCATLILGAPDPFTEAEGPLDSNDTRMQQVTYAAGKLWGALDTTLTVNNVNETGIQWSIFNPVASRRGCRHVRAVHDQHSSLSTV